MAVCDWYETVWPHPTWRPSGDVEPPPRHELGERGGNEHGSRSRYVAGCRCDLCREASRVYKALYRAARRYEGKKDQ